LVNKYQIPNPISEEYATLSREGKKLYETKIMIDEITTVIKPINKNAILLSLTLK
jgi:hypothetical protein